MQKPWLHWFATLVALGALVLIVDGAMIGPGTQPAPSLSAAHRIASIPLSILTLGLVLWLVFTDPRPLARRLAWLTLALAILQDSVGHAAVFTLVPRTAGMAHACLAQLFFAALVAMAMVTSPAWSRGPELVSDYGWPSNRSLAILTPVLVLLQIALGAAFRQKALTLLPHVLGAMFVALVILLESIFALQQFPTHRALRPAAKTLLGIAFGQVFLGISALTVKTMADDTALPVIVTVAAHVTGGALTLAATVVLSILVRRNVQPRVEEDEEAPAAS